MPSIKNISARLVYAFADSSKKNGCRPGDCWTVTAEEYEAAKKSQHWGKSFGPGTQEMPPARPLPRLSLAGLPEDKSLAEIAACTSLDQLQAWASKEKRKGVSEALEARVLELAGA